MLQVDMDDGFDLAIMTVHFMVWYYRLFLTRIPFYKDILVSLFTCDNYGSVLQGMTRLFLTRIPFFKDVLVSSFTSDNCGSVLQGMTRLFLTRFPFFKDVLVSSFTSDNY
jgi:C4-type Zn-finger protein